MNQEERYLRLPQEIKDTRRWVCYRVEPRDGKKTKIPYNPISGSFAKSNDPSTWCTFRIATMGCGKYHMDGIGFMLGDGYFGIDLDNHADQNGNKPMSAGEFEDFAKEFIDALNSYAEYSQSGDGVHIICKGTLPTGARRKAGSNVEMYDRGRFFAMTGNAIRNVPIADMTEQVVPLWEKYLNQHKEEDDEPAPIQGGINFGSNVRQIEITPSKLGDNDLLNRIMSSRFGSEFTRLYNGDMSAYSDDHSSADMALCKILAFWTGCDQFQMDRIFRSSALMRPKWDQHRGELTYGEMTIQKAISTQTEVYTPPKERFYITEPAEEKAVAPMGDIVLFDDRHDPIIKVKQIFKDYSLTDTGNAERFYDYFGDSFRYNGDRKSFMFWNGKTWVTDNRGYAKKYADRIIDILKSEMGNTDKELQDALKRGEEGAEEADALKSLMKFQARNIDHVSSKNGKEAMIAELQHLHELPTMNGDFDTQENLLNTDSGVVDLYTGDIAPFDKDLMLSKNTNCKVSFDEPIVWKRFLNDIFERPDKEETAEIIDAMQMALGESLTGRTNKDHLFILYGHGSNGKSTFVKVVNDAFGDYGTSMNSDLLIQNPNASSQSNEFSMSALLGARMVSTSETAEGKKLDEVTIKRMLSGEKINAQFKYGQPFSFMPTFSPWMSTNNRPIIRATDFGTWRRIFYVPFLNTFTDEKKDVDMPKKLSAELPQILGWMIQGSVKLHAQYHDKLPTPKCIEEALADYKRELDVITAFVSAKCIPFPGLEIEASKLYKIYKEWCKDNEEYMYSESRFRMEMPKKGYMLRKDPNHGWMYSGLKLAEDHRGLVLGVED